MTQARWQTSPKDEPPALPESAYLALRDGFPQRHAPTRRETPREAPDTGASPDGSGGPRAADAWKVLCGAVFLVYAGLVVWRSAGSSSTTTAVIAAPLALLAALPIIRRVARDGRPPALTAIMFTGLGLRLCGSVFRSMWAADANSYHEIASAASTTLRAFNFDLGLPGEVPGTGAMRYIVSVVEVFTAGDRYSTFVAFAFVNFLAACLFFVAFRLALPDGDHGRYAKLIFLFPSMIFWPSSIGKESWMLLGLSVASVGVALVFRQRTFRGLLLVGLGAAGDALVRPHVALIIVASLAFAVVLGRSASGNDKGVVRTSFSVGAKVVAIPLLLIGGAILAGKTAELLKVDQVGTEGVTAGLESAEDRTSQGGSAFTPAVVRTPLQYPLAAATILFRPFPVEAHNAESLLSAAETTFVALLCLASWRRLMAAFRSMRDRPYIAYAVGYVLIFIFAFSSIGNFGILARQRTQMLPFLFVILSAAIPSAKALHRAPGPARSTPARR